MNDQTPPTLVEDPEKSVISDTSSTQSPDEDTIPESMNEDSLEGFDIDADVLRNNIETSMLAIEDLKKAGQYTECEIDAAFQAIKKIVDDGAMGLYHAESILGMLKQLNYDNDVAKANAEGELRGRNAEIVRRMDSQPSSGDGIPHLGSGSNSTAYRNASIFDLASMA